MPRVKPDPFLERLANLAFYRGLFGPAEYTKKEEGMSLSDLDIWEPTFFSALPPLVLKDKTVNEKKSTVKEGRYFSVKDTYYRCIDVFESDNGVELRNSDDTIFYVHEGVLPGVIEALQQLQSDLEKKQQAAKKAEEVAKLERELNKAKKELGNEASN